MGIEYYEMRLKTVLNEYVKSVFTKKDWEVIAIDVASDRVILKRYEFEKTFELPHEKPICSSKNCDNEPKWFVDLGIKTLYICEDCDSLEQVMEAMGYELGEYCEDPECDCNEPESD